ncbi:LuxR C-terminal-related transcriptional regulator [Daeguia caeni]|uniref:HTH-type quorum sensing-dependent transcriptional regulator VjbR n=1 Tax=Daeguia caeni TaxID=439612 RepID=A0ABV9H2K6_9HYPH
MSLDLIHFPNFKKTFFGSAFQNDTLALLTHIRDEINCRHIIHTYHGRINETPKPNSSDLTVILTVPSAWIARYSAKNYFSIDPVFQENSPLNCSDGTSVVCDIMEGHGPDSAAAELYSDAEKHGLGNLFVGASACNSKGVIGHTVFTFDIGDQDRKEFIAKMRPRLLSYSGTIQNAICGAHDVRSIVSLLTPREIDCLSWAANGKTDAEIAEILNIARWTVVTYLQNAKIKLNCSNRTSAVATALSLGIIEMPEVRHLL